MLLLFVYVFGGALGTQTGSIDYVDFITPGVLIMTVASGIAYAAVRLSTDLQKGIISRFRTMPVAPSSVLSGQALSSTLSNLFSCALVIVATLRLLEIQRLPSMLRPCSGNMRCELHNRRRSARRDRDMERVPLALEQPEPSVAPDTDVVTYWHYERTENAVRTRARAELIVGYYESGDALTHAFHALQQQAVALLDDTRRDLVVRTWARRCESTTSRRREWWRSRSTASISRMRSGDPSRWTATPWP